MGAAIALVIATLLAATLIWTARPLPITPEDSVIPTAAAADLYALQARGFLKGQLHLDATPHPLLAQAANPYEPALRPPVFYPHDASLYGGRFYAYFGPAPALLLYAPWRALTGQDLPTAWAVFALVTVAYLGLAALFLAVARAAYPAASRTALGAGLIALGSASLLLPLARRPAMYEVAIASGVAAMAWGLYAAWRARGSTRCVAWCAWSGILFGLAVASRPTFGLAALPAWMIMSGTTARGGLGLRWHRGVTAAVLGGGVIVVALLAYNYARFGTPLEFGQRYQLSSVNEGAVRHFDLRFLATQGWLYLFSPLAWSAFFPFASVEVLASQPPGFGAHEYSFGLLAGIPFLWLAAWTYTQIGRLRAANPLAAPLLIGLVGALTPLLLYYYSCLRYQAEFAVWLAMAAALGGLEFERTRWRRVLVAGLAAAALVIVSLLCVRLYTPVGTPLPAWLEPIVRTLNRPAQFWLAGRGPSPGPITFELRLKDPPPAGDRHLLLAEGPSGESESVALSAGPNGGWRLSMQRTGRSAWQGVIDLPEVDPQSVHRLTVSLSSLYPLDATELDTALDPAAFRTLKNWVRLDWNGQPLVETPMAPIDWQTRRVLTQAADLAARGLKPMDGVLAVRREAPSPVSRPTEPWGGARITWTPLDGMRGRSFPLASSGQLGAGNTLFCRWQPNGEIIFGYDHWGKPSIASPPYRLQSGSPHTLEFWMPSLVSADRATPLVVKLDGSVVWTVSVPFYPAAPAERFLLRNAIGASSSEAMLPNATLEARGLPHPLKQHP